MDGTGNAGQDRGWWIPDSAFDYTRTVLAICFTVERGDLEGFARLVDGYERTDWESIAERGLSMLREAFRRLADVRGWPVEAIYQEELERSIKDEASGAIPRNLVLACLQRRVAEDQSNDESEG